MRDSPEPGRTLRTLAVVGVATLTLGSCGGMLLGRYTVTGMTPLGGSRPPSYTASRDEAPAADVEWIDAAAEVREARRAAEEIRALDPDG